MSLCFKGSSNRDHIVVIIIWYFLIYWIIILGVRFLLCNIFVITYATECSRWCCSKCIHEKSKIASVRLPVGTNGASVPSCASAQHVLWLCQRSVDVRGLITWVPKYRCLFIMTPTLLARVPVVNMVVNRITMPTANATNNERATKGPLLWIPMPVRVART